MAADDKIDNKADELKGKVPPRQRHTYANYSDWLYAGRRNLATRIASPPRMEKVTP